MPIAMFAYKDDKLAGFEDVLWAKELIGDEVKHFFVKDGGHMTFATGKDMTWFSKDAIEVLQIY